MLCWNNDLISPLWVETGLHYLGARLVHRFPKEKKAILPRRLKSKRPGSLGLGAKMERS